MVTPGLSRVVVVASAITAAVLLTAPAQGATPPPSPRAKCVPGSRPEPGMQGRVSAGDVESGRAAKGYTCNVKEIGQEGKTGGFKVLRYVDSAGHECAYYDTTLLFPLNAQNLGDQATGVAVLDMSNPAKPKRTTTLVTPAMQSPHESLNLSRKRGLLVAVAGSAAFYPGIIDVYDVAKDCRQPELHSSLPVGFLGHESGFAPDGRTFYATSLFSGHVTAVDLTNPKLPVPLKVFESFSHGLSVSDDGTRAYVAARDVGLSILDVSEIHARAPNPGVHEISRVTWPTMTIPQIAIPVTIGGRAYAVEVDEFSTGSGGGSFPAQNGPRAGVARIIDIEDEKHPKPVSEMRLQVHQPQNRAKLADDPGATSYVQGYAGHYCNVPRRKDPGIMACSFILSGLRVFDIRDPEHPKELAYFVAPPKPSPGLAEVSNYAMSSPDFVPERGEIWYSDGASGFHALRVAKGVWPFKKKQRPRPCLRPSKIAFRLHHNDRSRVVKVEAYVNGKLWRVKKGHDVKRIVLRDLERRGRMKIRIVATHNSGAKVVSRRSWKGCKKSEVHVHVVPRPSR